MDLGDPCRLPLQRAQRRPGRRAGLARFQKSRGGKLGKSRPMQSMRGPRRVSVPAAPAANSRHVRFPFRRAFRWAPAAAGARSPCGTGGMAIGTARPLRPPASCAVADSRSRTVSGCEQPGRRRTVSRTHEAPVTANVSILRARARQSSTLQVRRGPGTVPVHHSTRPVAGHSCRHGASRARFSCSLHRSTCRGQRLVRKHLGQLTPQVRR